jgi:ribose transport system substrate-binding protein
MISASRRVVLLLLALATLGLSCGRTGAPPTSASGRSLTIAVIPKGMIHEFWKSIHAGAVRAGRELGVEVLWKGPQKEDDRAQQITVVEDFINRGVSGIVLAPLDDRALVRPVQDAVAEKIPVVVIDSGLEGGGYLSFVATDNFQGGVMAARRLGGLLGGSGRIFLVRYQEGSASTTARERGFLETVAAEFPGLTLLSKDQYAGPTTESAYQLGENLLGRFPDVDGVFCPNESSTFGASPKLVQGLRDGEIHGLILQNPVKMGYLGVSLMVQALRGAAIPERVDTGVYLATRENMDTEEIRGLLSPDLSILD